MTANRQMGSDAGRAAAWLLVIVLAVGVRFYDISGAYVSYDEAFSVWISSLSPEAIWFHTGKDVHPPLYYLLLHYWMGLFGTSPVSIRSLSAVAGSVAVVLSVALARRVMNGRAVMISGLFVALFPAWVRLSQEARMYALEGMFLTGALWALISWLKQPERYRYCLLYAAFMVAALYTHYYAVLAALAHWLYLIVLRVHPCIRKRYITAMTWWVCNVLIVIAYVPWLFSLFDLLKNYEKLKAVGGVSWLGRGSIYTIPDTFWLFFTLYSPFKTSVALYALVPLLMLLVVGRVVVKDRTHVRGCTGLALYLFVPMVSLFCLSLFMPAYIERYVAFSAIGFPLLFAIGVASLSRKSIVKAALLLVAVLGMEGVGLAMIYSQQGEMGYGKSHQVVRLQEAVDYINAHRKDTDVVVVGHDFFYFSSVYYNGSDKGMYLYLPSLGYGGSHRPNGYGPSTLMYETWDEHTVSDPAYLPPATQRIWWLTGSSSVAEYPAYPGAWPEVDYLPAGEVEVRLYQRPAQ